MSLVTLLVLMCGMNLYSYADPCTPTTPQGLAVDAPPVEKAHAEELASYLIDFQQAVCGLTSNPNDYPQYAAVLTFANGNRGSALLGPLSMDNVAKELEALNKLGVTVMRLEVEYPLFTPAFHSFLNSHNASYTYTANDYLQFYKNVVAAARAYGFKIHIEHAFLFSGSSVIDPAWYFSTIKALGPNNARIRVAVENAAETKLIVTELQPDYLTLLSEPDTQNGLFGLIQGQVLYTPQQWKAYLDYAIGQFPANNVKLGAGAGTWDSQYIDLFAPMPTLDYIDLHIYPARSTFTDFYDRFLTLADLIRFYDPNKEITIGESWLYKVDQWEVTNGNVPVNEIISRDVYSYWMPLDKLFIELFSEAAKAKEVALFTPFWTRHFYSYTDYAEAKPLNPLIRMSVADQRYFDNLQAGITTGTGDLHKSLALQTNILVVGEVSPDHGPQTGPGVNIMVTISGENFVSGGGTTVFFGSNQATNVQVLNANTITAIVPAGTGSVDVTVNSSDGRIRTKPQAYTYDPPPVVTSVAPNSGRESSSSFLMINGDNFVTGSTNTFVFVGSLAATQITVHTKGLITAYTPSGIGLGTVNVSVRNPDLQTGILDNAYTFVPPPQITSFTPIQGPKSGGTVVTITGQKFIPGSTTTVVKLGGKDATGVTVLSATSIRAVSPSGLGSVKIRVTNPDLQTVFSSGYFTYK